MKAIILGLLALALATPAWSQPLSREDLLEALRQRDQAIAALEKRVAALEAGHSTAEATPTAEAPAPARPQAAGESARSSDDVALQALSRGLVARGALVLPKWGVEVAPSLAYSHTSTQGLVLVDTPEGISTVSSQRLRQDNIGATMAMRLGLPWESQAEVRLPYNWSREARALGDGSHTTDDLSSVGDIEVELSHQFLQERGWQPDLVGGFTWRFPTGKDPFRTTAPDIANGVGGAGFRARLTALKSSDPMVFFTTLSYEHNLGVDESFGRVHPGDAVNWQVGGLLAVSPDTSLSLGLSQRFKGKTRVDDVTIAGSDGVASLVQFGVDQVISPRVLLNVSVGVGVTHDAPDYVFLVSLPVRLR